MCLYPPQLTEKISSKNMFIEESQYTYSARENVLAHWVRLKNITRNVFNNKVL